MAKAAPRPGLVIAALASAGISSAFTQTMVTPLVALLPGIFDTTAENTAWIFTATLLAAAIAVPISGRLGDLFGKRRMIFILAIPLIIGAIMCALAPNVQVMIAGRAMQGLGSGMVPLGIAILRDVVPKERLASGIATVSATLGAGAAIGLPIAAAVIEFSSWRILFWAAAVVTGLIVLTIWLIVPAVPAGAKGQRFDGVGAAGLAVGLVALILGVSKGSVWGWGSPLTLSLLIAAAVVFVLWGVWETRTTDPLIDLRTTVKPRVLLTNVASVFVGFGMYASSLVFPQVLQLSSGTGYGLGQSILAAGLWMAPAGLMMLVLSPVGGRMSNTRGPKFTFFVGVVILAAGYGVALLAMSHAWGILLAGLVVNSGVAFAYGAMPAIIMSAVPRSETGAANGFNTLMRSLGTTIGSSIVGIVLAQMTIQYRGATVPSEAGFHTVLIIGAGVALIAAVIVAFIPAAKADVERVAAPVIPGSNDSNDSNGSNDKGSPEDASGEPVLAQASR
ncbi:MFS family permease [Leucobacter exalbidus]|uniref:MFS family permease n=1 Tax=Leucobacter exalbidus TaxID=662960 RepID=A0A940PNV4_9MICO|nr:MFS transporter [Leucobacter exalbidus]MBP1326603.1 MFS family permease [Leucobacter exalbidus]